MSLPQLNPFHLPGWAATPMRPLCPWRYPEHRDYYLSVDRADEAFEEFTDRMGDLDPLLADGQLVLVTGDSGCGKTALVNRCADWVVQRLADRKLRGDVIDLTPTLNGGPQRSVDDRVSIVCDRLFDQARLRGALRPDAIEELKDDRERPDRIYPRLPRALADGRVLIILLPSPGDLVDEVVRYASLAQPKVLFLAESAFFDEDEVHNIVRKLEAWVPPITPRVGSLRKGDVRLFASDRLTRHADAGTYPRMSEETMDSASVLLRTVAQLQRSLHGTYQDRLRQGLRYDEADSVTIKDITDFFDKESRIGLGKQP